MSSGASSFTYMAIECVFPQWNLKLALLVALLSPLMGFVLAIIAWSLSRLIAAIRSSSSSSSSTSVPDNTNASNDNSNPNNQNPDSPPSIYLSNDENAPLLVASNSNSPLDAQKTSREANIIRNSRIGRVVVVVISLLYFSIASQFVMIFRCANYDSGTKSYLHSYPTNLIRPLLSSPPFSPPLPSVKILEIL